MGIQKDAGELLLYFYDVYTKKGVDMEVRHHEIMDMTKWEKTRLDIAIYYLVGRNLIAGIDGFGGFYSVDKVLPDGIDIIENKNKFKRTFNFEVGVPGLFKFSWGASER